ncbi:hypothetical protein DINM_006462 [Dirofilaria immitis]|nr:hypothetical protein [Dirofilaria immitis]
MFNLSQENKHHWARISHSPKEGCKTKQQIYNSNCNGKRKLIDIRLAKGQENMRSNVSDSSSKVAAAAAAAVAAVAAALHSNHIAVYAENFSRHATSSDQLDSCMQTHALPCSADYQFRPNYEQ